MINLDQAATTKILPKVLETMMPYLAEEYGNPSSHYELGRKASDAISEAREIIANSINAHPEEIYFTSGGSEGNSWAIKGLKDPYKFHKMHIITTNIEHHSITASCDTRKKINNDIEVSYAAADKSGIVPMINVANMFKPNTRLVSVMTVNNETGVIQPIQQIAYMAKDNGAYVHTDAVQAFGHLRLKVDDLGIDLMTVSGHKIHAPKGVGFLYISNDVRQHMYPLINGGQQEMGLRGSTENVAAIVGLGKATEIAMANMTNNWEYCKKLSDYCIEQLSNIPEVHLNVPFKLTDYRHVNVRIEDVRAEELMALLDTQGVYISSGSACNSNSNKPSHVLKAIGLTDDQANSSIRISIGETTTKEEIETALNYIKMDIEMLRGKNV